MKILSSFRVQSALLLGLKIGLGCALAVWMAQMWGLSNPISAGTVTLLTLVNTKWGTLELVWQRYLSFGITVGLGLLITVFSQWNFVSFGFVLAVLVFITEILKWGKTLSVNALVLMHFMQADAVHADFILNELRLVSIGVVLAVFLNLFYAQRLEQKHLRRHIRRMDLSMQQLLGELESYIRNEKGTSSPWKHLEQMEKDLDVGLALATQLLDNSFSSAPQCFISYFKMRSRQFVIVRALHMEIRHVKTMENEAQIIGDFLHSLIPHVTDHNEPAFQLVQLHEIIDLQEDDYVCEDRQSFEDKARFFHIMMDLQDFLLLKKAFIDGMDDEEQALFFQESAHGLN